MSLIDEPSWKELGESTLGVTMDLLRSASGKLMKSKETFTGDTQFKNATLRTVFFVKHGRGSNLLHGNELH